MYIYYPQFRELHSFVLQCEGDSWTDAVTKSKNLRPGEPAWLR